MSDGTFFGFAAQGKYSTFVFCFQGIYQKAQALYYQGDFEMALVFYHRGHKLRPELQEFRLGIQKAQEAIDNSVGCKYRASRPKHRAVRPHPCFVNIPTAINLPTASQSRMRRKSDWSLSRVFAVSRTPSPKLFGARKKSPTKKAVAFKTGKQNLFQDLTWFWGGRLQGCGRH